MLEYLSSLRAAASSSAEPASRAPPATYESANGRSWSYTGLVGFNPRQLKVLKWLSSHATDLYSVYAKSSSSSMGTRSFPFQCTPQVRSFPRTVRSYWQPVYKFSYAVCSRRRLTSCCTCFNWKYFVNLNLQCGYDSRESGNKNYFRIRYRTTGTNAGFAGRWAFRVNNRVFGNYYLVTVFCLKWTTQKYWTKTGHSSCWPVNFSPVQWSFLSPNLLSSNECGSKDEEKMDLKDSVESFPFRNLVTPQNPVVLWYIGVTLICFQ